MDDWIKWERSESPVSDSIWLEVKLRNGKTLLEYAKDIDWVQENHPFDVVAYRILTDENFVNCELINKTFGNEDEDDGDLKSLKNTIEAQSRLIQQLNMDKENLTIWIDKLINALGK